MHLTSRSGRHIQLRPPREGDESILFAYARLLEAEDTYVLLNPDYPVTWAEETEYLKNTLRKLAAHWEVMLMAFSNDLLIGSCQVSVLGRRKMHVGQFGISLLPDYRQDGIGEPLSRLVIKEAHKTLKVTIITLEVFSDNQAALNLYQKLGFTEYGRLPRGLKFKDAYNDLILMSLNL